MLNRKLISSNKERLNNNSNKNSSGKKDPCLNVSLINDVPPLKTSVSDDKTAHKENKNKIVKIVNLIYIAFDKKLRTINNFSDKEPRYKINNIIFSNNNIKFGRMRKEKIKTLTIEEKYKSKMRRDNVETKIKTHFFIFMFNFINLLMGKNGISLRFINIKRKIKYSIKPSQYKNLCVKDVMKLKNNKRKTIDEKKNHNLEVYNIAKNISKINDIFNMNLHDFFINYYIGSNREKLEDEFGLNVAESSAKINFFDDLCKTEYSQYKKIIEDVLKKKFK